LHAELVRREPEMIPELHTRAASWCEANDVIETAIEHAQRGGDADRVARLVLQVSPRVWASGRLDTVLGWVEWFSINGLIESHPAIAVHGALIYALIGKAGDAERLARLSAQHSAAHSPMGTRSTPPWRICAPYCAATMSTRCAATLRLRCRVSARPARTGRRWCTPRASVVSSRGDPDQADVFFARALLAERGIAAIERDDSPEAEALAKQALVIMGDGRFDDYWSSALVYAWNGRLAARRGDMTQARDMVARAARLRPLLTHALPVVSVQALLELAHAYVALADVAGARAALRQIADIHQRRPELGNLPGRAKELRSKVDMLRGEMVGVSSLTTAELRLVPLLPTYLSMEEISQRLAVSRNTVKSQAISIYRKLGTSSRGETVTRLHQFGIVSHP
jgi:LuxR family transcriptional regulator, maltose regulon positive regulatory protein